MSGVPVTGALLAGKYRIEQILGVGGFGAVVAAHHLQLDQKVAIKYLLPEALANAEIVERFAREARAAAKIRGEHVVRVIDVGNFEDGAPYMVMEYLEGHDLAKELERRGPLQVEDAVRYVLEACEALAQAHAAKIVHRDLKPSNLFLAIQPDKRSIVKVLDFGISKVESSSNEGALTKTSGMMGTAYYMSPEQMTAPKDVDHRSDIWALGVILYELLTGGPPFPGMTIPEVVAGILRNQREPLRSKRPDVPERLATAIEKCMMSSPADRHANVAALSHAIAPFAHARDRQSVESVARVLGETFQIPSSGTPQTPPVDATLQSSDLSARPRPPGSPASSVTAHNISTRTSEAPPVPPKRNSAIVAAVVAISCAIGAAAVVVVRRGAAPTPVAAMAPPATTTASVASPPEAPAAIKALETLPVAAPAAEPPREMPKADEPRTRGRVRPATSAATPATPKPAAAAPSAPLAAPAVPVSAAPAPAAPTQPKNPLQMGIK